MIIVKDLSKGFTSGDSTKTILKDINFRIDKGLWCSITGPSGTGKSTLLNCLSGLLEPDEGIVHIGNEAIYELSENQLSDFRRKNIGFVFQDFKLLPHYSVLDNVMLPLLYDEEPKELATKAKYLLTEVGIQEHLFNRLPTNLSGGEKQRVAIARALIAEPDNLLCDEPTGNLDVENRNQIMDLLHQVKKRGQTIVVVTHDEEVAALGDIEFQLKEGALREVVIKK